MVVGVPILKHFRVSFHVLTLETMKKKPTRFQIDLWKIVENLCTEGLYCQQVFWCGKTTKVHKAKKKKKKSEKKTKKKWKKN